MYYDVTIGIPVYQAEEFINRTMESALAQSYSNIEYLIIDDGSQDDSIIKIRQLQCTHPRGNQIRIISHQHNQGVAEARNTIISEAKGEYLYFMDSDDIIVSDTIELLMSYIKKYGADIVFGSYEKTELNGEKILYQYPDTIYQDNDDFACFAYRKYFGIQASACNFLVKTSLLRDNHLKFCNSRFWEDTIFTLELVTYIKKAVTLSTITYSYLRREKSLSDIRSDERIEKKEIRQYFKTVDELKQRKESLIKKPYYPNRCYIAIMSDIYIICNILKRWNYITPSFSLNELKSQLNHPATLSQILAFRQTRLKNLFLYSLGKLPAPFSIGAIWCMGKMKRII